jgi:hypothetical protein
MSETAEMAPQIDAEATETNAGLDDARGGPEFTPEAYDAVAREVALDGTDDAERPGDQPDGEPEPDLAKLPTKVQSHIQKLRKENAQRRVSNDELAAAKAELDQQLTAAAAENQTLRDWRDEQQRRDVERLADMMIAPGDLWFIAELGEMLDDDGEIDPAKVRDVIADRVPSHWRRRLSHGDARPRSGASGIAGPRATSWAAAIGRPEE